MLQTQRHRSHEAKSFVASWNWSCKSLREPLDSLHSLKPGTKNVAMLAFTSLQAQENRMSPLGSIPAAQGQAGLTPEPPRTNPFGFPAFLPPGRSGSVTSRLGVGKHRLPRRGEGLTLAKLHFQLAQT